MTRRLVRNPCQAWTWAWLAPTGSLFFSTETDPGLQQDCVLVRYVILGRHESGSATAGAWTVEVPDHALGRLRRPRL